ncbi:TlpA family protein disulfide reductase [Flavobacterium sp. HNIBRBA15423]|uniref:TlpA family protein disulfide reductase n=1 Tax=Flavobacterium sp. HNIBRBA15423 TaxID=3458683 RepID=UPI0040443641
MLDKLPNLNFKNIDGSTMNFNEFKNKNKLIYVEFWATWCSPCIAMLPEIKRLHSECYNELEIINIHSERSVDIKKIKDNIDKYQMNWINGISTIEINNNFNFGACPKGFLFDQEGNLLIYDASPILIKEYIKNIKK